MARMTITGFPHPPENERWCAVCVALAKGEFFGDPDLQERVKAGLADDKREVFAIAMDPKFLVRRLELAISAAGHPLIMRGALCVPLCALHMPAVDPAQPGPAEPPPAPGLYRGGGLN